MGSNAYHFLANGLRSSGKIYGAAAINNVSKVLRGNVVTGIATTVVMSVPDFYRMFNGKMSGGQVFKNVTKTGVGVAGGVGGYVGGAAAGAAIGSVVPVVGTFAGALIGGIFGSFAGGTAGSKVAEVVLDGFIEDDASEMMEIIEEVFGKLSFDYLLNQNEADKAIATFTKKDVPELLRNMYASDDRPKYATKKIEEIIISIVQQRPKIILPTNQEIIDNMGEVIDELVDNENKEADSTNKTSQIEQNIQIDNEVRKKDFFDFRLGDPRLVQFLEDELAYYRKNYPSYDIRSVGKKILKYEKYLKEKGHWNGELKDLVKKMQSCNSQM
jgi:hypothetical protein